MNNFSELLIWALFVIAAVTTVLLIEEVLMEILRSRRARRISRVEAELDRTQAELRHTILRLADDLGGSAHEARKALIRESYLATGQAPGETAREAR